VVVVVEGVVVQDQLAILSRTKRDPTKSTKKKFMQSTTSTTQSEITVKLPFRAYWKSTI
jgi:hypothetical protein